MSNVLGEGDIGNIIDPASFISEETGLPSPGQLTSDFAGITGAEAQREAARIQEELGREALAEQEAAQLRMEETLAPFVQFGLGALPEFQALFAPTVSQAINQSPVVTDLTRLADQQILANQAINPRAAEILAADIPISGIDLLGRQRGDLLSALRLGQASAAQQAAGDISTGGARADLLTQIGNVQAAGGIGAARSLAQGGQNIAGLGSAALEFFR